MYQKFALHHTCHVQLGIAAAAAVQAYPPQHEQWTGDNRFRAATKPNERVTKPSVAKGTAVVVKANAEPICKSQTLHLLLLLQAQDLI